MPLSVALRAGRQGKSVREMTAAIEIATPISVQKAICSLLPAPVVAKVLKYRSSPTKADRYIVETATALSE